MSQRLLLGVALLVGLMPGATPEAAPVKVPATRLVSATSNGEATLRVEGKGVTFSKRVGKDHVVMRFEVPRDRIELEVNMDGRVRLVRNGKVLQVEMKQDTPVAIGRVKAFTSGSSALAGLETLVASLTNDDRREAQSLRVSHALVQALRGNAAPALAFAASQAPRSDGAIVRVMSRSAEEGPFACWAEYSATVYNYNVELNDCVGQYWWIPGWTAACGAQWSIQVELAWFWLLSCSGGMPV